MVIYTHVSVDLDAVMSVAAARAFVPGAALATVVFKPANWNGDGAADGDLILDIDAGGKGVKGRVDDSGRVHSCFESIVLKYASPEDQQALSELVSFVDAQDTYGSAAKFFVPDISPHAQDVLSLTSVSSVLRAFQTTRRGNDAEVVELMGEIFSGMLRNGRNRMRAEQDADNATWFGDGRVALISPTTSGTTKALRRRGALITIYHDGYNVGVVRRDDCTVRTDHPEIRAVIEAAGEVIKPNRERPGEWFSHSSGFMISHGSRKAPETVGPSAVDLHDLAHGCVRALDSALL